MRNPEVLHASCREEPPLPWVDALACLQFARNEVVHLMPLGLSQTPGYIWRRVFLKRGRKHV